MHSAAQSDVQMSTKLTDESRPPPRKEEVRERKSSSPRCAARVTLGAGEGGAGGRGRQHPLPSSSLERSYGEGGGGSRADERHHNNAPSSGIGLRWSTLGCVTPSSHVGT